MRYLTDTTAHSAVTARLDKSRTPAIGETMPNDAELEMNHHETYTSSMLAATKVIATCFLVVGVGFTHGDVFKQNSRSAGKAAIIAVKPSGSDASCRRGSLSRPCATLNKAYSLAHCGDVAEVGAGSYGDQHIIETKAGSACKRNPIVLRAVPGTRPTINWISFGRWGGGPTRDAPDNLILRGFKVTWGLSMWGDVTNVTLDDLDGGSFFIAGGTNVTVKNSDWGPCTPSGSFQGKPADCRNYFPGIGAAGRCASSAAPISSSRTTSFTT